MIRQTIVAENTRWEKQKEKLEVPLRGASDEFLPADARLRWDLG